ncbi:related to multidrug resistance protein [Phialocephala subalpina]|uniref:Related to multidrug resistance protein n=1 Tax=Phialocephala subalpina TaxID=576137 RepID=A0A1L7XU31_9HELO|nr:related to multidrug resistance protein [Phialocephala subalpina]
MASEKENASKEETSINIRDGANHKATSSNGEVTLTPENEKASNPRFTEQEQRILDRQIDTPLVKISYFMLYRYATKVDLIIITISTICAIAAGSVFPLMTASIPNTSSKAPTSNSDTHLALYFVYLAVGNFVTIYIATVGFIYAGEHMTQKLREKYLAAILRQNIAYFDKLGAGEITTRITSDMADIQGGISEKVGLTLTGVSTFVGAIIVGFVKDWKLTLILFSVIFAMVFCMGGFARLIVRFMTESKQYSGTGATLAEEVFSSIRNATALGTQDRLAKEYDRYLLKAEKGGFKMKTVTGTMLGAMMFIMFCNYGLSFWQGSRFLVKGEIGLNSILTIMLAMMMGAVSLGQVAPHTQAFAVAIATGGPVFSLIDRPSSHEEVRTGKAMPAVEGEIELRGVKHVYPSRQEVVVMKDVSLTIPSGKVTALVGASGSGKSTIIGLIERFYPPVAGQVLLDGEDIQTLDLKWLRQQMALVSQEPVLFRTSVYGNIAHGLIGSQMEDASDEKKMELVIGAAKTANAHEFITSLPEGYDTDVGERGFLMSGGQKQRIAIARAVVSDPKILLLDEATSALDTKSEGVVQSALDAASKGRTTIVIAHRLSTIKGADKIVVMAEGGIVEQGSHDELIRKNGAYVELLEAQRMVAATKAQNEIEHDEEGIVLEKSHTRGTSTSEVMMKPTRTMTRGSQYSSANTPSSHPNYSLWTLVKFITALNRQELSIMSIGLFFSIIAGSTHPLQAVYMGKCISALSLPVSEYHKLRRDVNFWALMFFITGLAILISYFIQGITFAYGSERLIFRARSKAIRAMLRQDISFFDQPENSSGALVSMLSTEVTALAGISGATLGSILSACSTIVIALTLSSAIKWQLGLVCATAMPVLICCGFSRFWVLAQFNGRARKAYEQSASFACEATAAIRTIASLTREDEVWELYHEMLVDQTKKSLRSVISTSSLYAASQACMFGACALGFWWGGTLISRHELSIEAFFICFASTIFGAQAAGGIFSFAPDMGKSKQAADALKTLLDRVPEIDSWSEEGEKVDVVQGAIEFKDVHFRYPTRLTQPVLRGIDLKFEPGQYVALVGPSGCGKSTVVSLIERFYDPKAGSVLLDGKDISTLNLKDYRSNIALVSQEPVLYSGTIRDNIVSGAVEDADKVDDDTVEKACKGANIHEFISSLPDGLNTIVGSKGVMLSGGQKQRVAIARALIRDPKILLLDEATSALDSTSERVVQAALDSASKGRTTIAIAHRLSTVQNADVIYVLDGGVVVESGDHSSLMEKRGRYFELVRMQGLKGKE